MTVEQLADLFVLDITDGIDELDYSGPIVRRTPFRAGVIKVAGSEADHQRATGWSSRPAAAAHLRTGAPILTHCERGRADSSSSAC